MNPLRNWYWTFTLTIVRLLLLGLGYYFRATLTVPTAIATIAVGGGLVLVPGRWLLIRLVLWGRDIRVPDWVALIAVLALGVVLYFVLDR